MVPIQKSEGVQSEEMLRKPEVMGFGWLNGVNEHWYQQGIGLAESQDESYAYVVIHKPFPEIPDELQSGLKEFINKNGEKVLYAGFGNFDIGEKSVKKMNIKPSLTRQQEQDKAGEKPNPKTTKPEEVAKLFLGGKKVIVYTGAGISVASGTPSMAQLEETLGMTRPRNIFDKFTRDIILDPQSLKERLMNLSKVFYQGSTTAHKVITVLQKRFGLLVTTENLDKLHQHAGTEVIRRNDIDTLITDEALQKTEYILTIGLKSDDSGLLHRYKTVNSSGKFIALNIEVPSYLNDNDYYLEGDVQTTVPLIEKLTGNDEA